MTLNLIWLLVAFCAGAAIAVGITLAVARPKAGKKSLAELKETHESYRGDVTTHFVDTAKLVNEMTDSYKALFDHLQSGAENLLDESTLREQLTADGAEVITLSRLGHRTNSDEPPVVTESDSATEDADAETTAEQSADQPQEAESTDPDISAEPTEASENPDEPDPSPEEQAAEQDDLTQPAEAAADESAPLSGATDDNELPDVGDLSEAEITNIEQDNPAPEERQAQTA